MDATKCESELRKCRTFAEASKILEMNGAGRSASELLRIGFAVKANQPEVFENNLQTVIREIEDEKKENQVHETDGGESHQSTSTTGTTDVAGRTPEKDVESAEGASGESQTQEMGGMYPPQVPPQMPPQQVPPQKPIPQPQQQMQYMQQVDETLKKYAAKIVELEKQVNAPKSLEIGSKTGNRMNFSSLEMPAQKIRETTTDGKIQERTQTSKHLQDVRASITGYDNYLNDNRITPQNPNPY